MERRWRLAKNAIANLLRGGAASIVVLLLPAVLVRRMSQMDYSVWLLVLQVAAYCSYLEFGLQKAVGRFIAVSHERQDDEQRDAIYTTALPASLELTFFACAGSVFLANALLPGHCRDFDCVGAALVGVGRHLYRPAEK